MLERGSCALCKGRKHTRPRRDVTVYLLTCPSDTAPQEEQDAFTQQLADCTYVDNHYGRKAAVDLDLVPQIIARRDATLQRGQLVSDRKESLPDRAVESSTLIADAQARTPEAVKFSEADRYIRDADFEVDVRKIAQELGEGQLTIDPPHVTVPEPAPSRGEFTPTPRMKTAKADTTDYLLHLGDENL